MIQGVNKINKSPTVLVALVLSLLKESYYMATDLKIIYKNHRLKDKKQLEAIEW